MRRIETNAWGAEPSCARHARRMRTQYSTSGAGKPIAKGKLCMTRDGNLDIHTNLIVTSSRGGCRPRRGGLPLRHFAQNTIDETLPGSRMEKILDRKKNKHKDRVRRLGLMAEGRNQQMDFSLPGGIFSFNIQRTWLGGQDRTRVFSIPQPHTGHGQRMNLCTRRPSHGLGEKKYGQTAITRFLSSCWLLRTAATGNQGVGRARGQRGPRRGTKIRNFVPSSCCTAVQ